MQKEITEFIQNSKRLRTTTSNGIHVRYLRNGMYRDFYYINEQTGEIRYLGRRKRSEAYDQKWINNLFRKLKKEVKHQQ